MTPKPFLAEKQLDEFDALADYLVMALVHGAESVSKHASHDQKSHGSWARNRSQLVAIRGYQERAGAKGFSGWNPNEQSIAGQMAEVTEEAIAKARESLLEIFQGDDDAGLRESAREARRVRSLRNLYSQSGVEKMPGSVRKTFDQLASSYSEIAAGGAEPDRVFDEVMSGYAEMTGLPVDEARRGFRTLRAKHDPLGLLYPSLQPSHWRSTEEGARLSDERWVDRNREVIAHHDFQEALERHNRLMKGLVLAEMTFQTAEQLPRGLKKHAQHDQQSHGNWARGRSVYADGGQPPAYEDKLDVENKHSAEANLLAEQLRARQLAHEPALTRLLDRIAVDTDGKLLSLKHRAKTTESLARKIDKDAAEENISREEAAADIKDVLRYTYQFTEASYTESILDVYEALSQEGFSVYASKNFWAPGDAYDGVNTHFIHPDGFKIEVQFHTPTSAVVKKPSHKLYEKYRMSDDYTVEERWGWWNEMIEMWEKVRRPPGIMDLPDVQGVELFKSLSKSAFRYFAKIGDDGTPRVYYRLAKGKKRIIEERWDWLERRWVDDADKSVSWWMVSGTPIELEEVENPGLAKGQPTSSDVHVPSAEWKKRKKKRRKTGLSGMVEKHAQHDQKTHGNWAKGRSLSRNVPVSVPAGNSAGRAVKFFAGALGVEATSAKALGGRIRYFVIPEGTTREQYLDAMKAGKAAMLEANAESIKVFPGERRRIGSAFSGLKRTIESSTDFQEELGLGDYADVVAKHAQHDQKTHGNWATGGSVPNPKPYAGRGKSTEGGDAARPLPKVGDRIGIHLDLGGKESGLGEAVAFSIKMVGKNGVPKYGTTQAHTTGVRLSDVSSHVNRSGLEGAIKRGEKNPHAAFTGTVEEWTTDRGIPEGAIEIDYWVAPKAKNADGSPKYTAETTGFWYAKDGTYREFIGASDGVGIGGVKGEGRARTYVYGDVELGKVNPHIKEAMESRGIGKAHRLIHESRALSLKKHASHDQKSHGNWARNRRIYNYIIENEGITFDLRGREHKTTGYAVADPEQAFVAEEKFSADEFVEGDGLGIIRDYTRRWKDELDQPGKFLGAWMDDDGFFYLDVATVVDSREKAVAMGKETNQLAIYDLDAGESIYIDKASGKCYLIPGSELSDDMLKVLYDKLVSGG